MNLQDKKTRTYIAEALQELREKKRTANKRAGVPETMEELDASKQRIEELEFISGIINSLEEASKAE